MYMGEDNMDYKIYIAKKINEYKSKEEEILATLDEKTIENLYNYALDNIEKNNPAYLDKLYFFIINYILLVYNGILKDRLFA